MLPADIRSLYNSYQEIYREEVEISSEMIEEIVEELVEECLEFGYTLDEATTAIEEAAELYFDEEELEEAKITYGSDTESPEQRTARAKEKLGGMKSAARKAAVKSAVSKVKSKVAGAAAGAVVGAHTAADTAKRAGASVSAAAKQKKAQIKTGVKKLLGRGLRAAASGAGKVAQVARKAGSAAGKAAERLGEEVIDEAIYSEKGKAKAAEMIAKRSTPSGRAKPGKGANVAQIRQIRGSGRGHFDREGLGGTPMTPTMAKNPIKKKSYDGTGNKAARRAGLTPTREKPNAWKEQVDIWDVVLEYLIANGHADTNAEALYVMSQLDEEMIQNILEDSATLSAAARKRAEELGRKRRSTKEYKQGLNRGTGRNERAGYNLSNIQRTHAANPSTQVSRSRKPAGYDTGAHKGDYERFNRSKPEKNPKHDANK